MWYILLLKDYIWAASFDLEANSAYHAYHLRRMLGSFLLWKCHACLKWPNLSQAMVSSAFLLLFMNLQSNLIWEFLFSIRKIAQIFFKISKHRIGDLEYSKCRVKAVCILIEKKNPCNIQFTIFTILNVWCSCVNYIHIIVQQNRSLEVFHLAKLKVYSHFTIFPLSPTPHPGNHPSTF